MKMALHCSSVLAVTTPAHRSLCPPRNFVLKKRISLHGTPIDQPVSVDHRPNRCFPSYLIQFVFLTIFTLILAINFAINFAFTLSLIFADLRINSYLHTFLNGDPPIAQKKKLSDSMQNYV